MLYAQGFLLMGGFVAVYNYLGFRLEAPPFLIPASLASLVFVAYLSGHLVLAAVRGAWSPASGGCRCCWRPSG